MARIKTAVPGPTLRRIAQNQCGYMPGIVQVLSPDLQTTIGGFFTTTVITDGHPSRVDYRGR